MSLSVLDFESDLPAELWVSDDTAWCWRAEQPWKLYADLKVTLVECEPAGPQMHSHP